MSTRPMPLNAEKSHLLIGPRLIRNSFSEDCKCHTLGGVICTHCYGYPSPISEQLAPPGCLQWRLLSARVEYGGPPSRLHSFSNSVSRISAPRFLVRPVSSKLRGAAKKKPSQLANQSVNYFSYRVLHINQNLEERRLNKKLILYSSDMDQHGLYIKPILRIQESYWSIS